MEQKQEEFISIPSIEVMTKRPEGMKYELYREKRKDLNKRLKERTKGILVYLSHELIQDPIIKEKYLSKKYPPLTAPAPSIKIIG